MKTLEINKENWTGENGNVVLYADGKTFKIYDEKFRIIEKRTPAHIEDGEEIFPAYSDYKLQRLSYKGEWVDTDEKGSEDCLDLYGGKYVFKTWTGDIVRSDDRDPRIAAAKLLFMIH